MFFDVFCTSNNHGSSSVFTSHRSGDQDEVIGGKLVLINLYPGRDFSPRLEGYVTQNVVGKMWKNEVTRALLFPSVSRYINTPEDLTLQQSIESIYFWTPWLKEFRGVRWGFFVVSQRVPSTKNVCELDVHGFSTCSMINGNFRILKWRYCTI